MSPLIQTMSQTQKADLQQILPTSQKIPKAESKD
jgi:hypothetical protein